MSPSRKVPPSALTLWAEALEVSWPRSSCGSDVEISIYEQASQCKETGAGVGIGVNAARLLHKIGLGDATAAIAGNWEDVWISFRRFDDGREIITVASDTRQVHRAEFLDLLVNAVQDRRAATLWK
jgi:salicylate hydroxylase